MPKLKWQLLQVEIPEKLKDDLASEMKAAGIPEPDSEERWTMALEALKVHSPTLDSYVVPACDTVSECSMLLFARNLVKGSSHCTDAMHSIALLCSGYLTTVRNCMYTHPRLQGNELNFVVPYVAIRKGGGSWY